MDNEILKPIPGFDGYLINESGQVFSLKNDASNQFSNGIHELKRLKRKYGGPVVGLSKDGKVYQKKVIRLVANVFDREKHFESKTNEIWNKTKLDFIEISNLGRVRKSGNYYNDSDMTYCKFKELKVSDNGYGYKIIKVNGKQQYIHRLVAKAFVSNPEKLPIVNHKDENKSNNYASNLEWCTQKYNANYGTIKYRQAWKRQKPVIGINKYDCCILSKADSGIRNYLKGWSNSSRGMKWYYLKFDFNNLRKLKLTNVGELEKQNEK